MKLSPEGRELFASEISKAQAKGLTHWAKPVGLPHMRFASSEAEAVRLATNAAKKFMRGARASGPIPEIQSGKI